MLVKSNKKLVNAKTAMKVKSKTKKVGKETDEKVSHNSKVKTEKRKEDAVSSRNKGNKSWNKSTINVIDDPRFSHIMSDPRFKEAPAEDVKIKLDSRFKSVLKDKNYMIKDTLDPRGRPKRYGTKETLDKFYEIDSDEEVDEESEENESGSESEDQIQESDKESNAHKTKEEFLQCLLDPEKDLARGEEFFSEDSSDDDSSTSEEDDEETAFGEFEWGELDKDAEWDCDGKDVEETHRFAVCDMDWDRIKAVDLMVLFSSFCSPSGMVKKVTIFPSEFGKARLKEEEEKGPQELVEVSKSQKSKMGAQEELKALEKISKGVYKESTAMSSLHIEALRRYQRNRLRYYYAVVECDSVETAKSIYKECDRMHFDVVGVTLDLRYIPSDMDFDETPHDECCKVPANYVSEKSSSMALQEAKPTLTWDETDHRRKKAIANTMSKVLKKERFDEDAIKDYIGDSEEEDYLDYSEYIDSRIDDDSDNEDSKVDRIAKFRSLISEIDQKAKEKNDSFPGDFDTSARVHGDSDDDDRSSASDNSEPGADDDTDKSDNEDKREKLTPFEKFLSKKREKRKIGKKLKKKSEVVDEGVEGISDGGEGSGRTDSETEVESPKALSDEGGPRKASVGAQDNKKLSKRKGKGASKNKTPHLDEKSQGSLSLLLMDEEKEDKKHFDMRKIREENKRKEKKANKKKNKTEVISEATDDFEVNWDDPRFSALFTSGNFHLDPSHPKYDPGAARGPPPGHNNPNLTVKRKRKDDSSEIAENSEQVSSLDSSVCSLVEKIRKKCSKLK